MAKPPRISALKEIDLAIREGPVDGKGLREVFRRLFAQVNPYFDGLNKLGSRGATLTENVRCELVTATLAHGVAQSIVLRTLQRCSGVLVLGCDTALPLGHALLQMTGNRQCSVTVWFTNPNITAAKVSLVLLEEGQQASTLPVIGAYYQATRTKVADAAYTALSTDYRIVYTSITVARIVTVPAAAASNAGQEYFLKDESGSATGAITIAVAPASGTIDGVASKVVIAAAYGAARVYSNGTAWFTA